MAKNVVFWIMVAICFTIAKVADKASFVGQMWFACLCIVVALSGWAIMLNIEIRKNRKKSEKLRKTFRVIN